MAVLWIHVAVECASYIDLRGSVSVVQNAPGHLLSGFSCTERVVFCQNSSITLQVWSGR